MAIAWEQGCLQIYTGNGKGKTTAALGLALRATGAGIPVFLGQFLKSGRYSEIVALQELAGQLTIRQFGRNAFVGMPPAAEDVQAARKGLAESADVLAEGQHPLVILDEVNVCVQLGLLTVSDLLTLADTRPTHVELVMTGQGAPAQLIARADLVTEMRLVKHYFDAGVRARKGIEL